MTLTPAQPLLAKLSDVLRETTRPQHERLHQLVDISSMMIGPAEYGRGLLKYWRFVAPLESQLQEYAHSHPEMAEIWQHRLVKRDWLRNDLQTVGSVWNEDDNLPVAAPEIGDLSDFVGISYVLEGMTLGGQGLCKQIERQHPEWAGQATHFFRSYGSNTMIRWGQWQAWANEQAVDVQQTAVMASKTFDYFVQVWSSEVTSID